MTFDKAEHQQFLMALFDSDAITIPARSAEQIAEIKAAIRQGEVAEPGGGDE